MSHQSRTTDAAVPPPSEAVVAVHATPELPDQDRRECVAELPAAGIWVIAKFNDVTGKWMLPHGAPVAELPALEIGRWVYLDELFDSARHKGDREAMNTAQHPKVRAAPADGLPQPLREPGQIKEGDLLRFSTSDGMEEAIAREVLYPGTDTEEVIVNKRRNYYFITAKAIEGTSWVKDVQIIPKARKKS